MNRVITLAGVVFFLLISGCTLFALFFCSANDSKPDPYPLHSAAVHWPGRMDAIVADGVSPDALNDIGRTPLQTAVSQRAQLGVAKLLTLGADPNIGNTEGNSPLAQAAMWGDLQTVRLLITFGADANAEYQARGALHHAIVHGHTAVLELLLKQPSINLDQQSTATGYTPLHLAVQHDRKEFIDLLLARHADAAIRDHAGNTPLDLAMNKSDTTLSLLLTTVRQ